MTNREIEYDKTIITKIEKLSTLQERQAAKDLMWTVHRMSEIESQITFNVKRFNKSLFYTATFFFAFFISLGFEIPTVSLSCGGLLFISFIVNIHFFSIGKKHVRENLWSIRQFMSREEEIVSNVIMLESAIPESSFLLRDWFDEIKSKIQFLAARAQEYIPRLGE